MRGARAGFDMQASRNRIIPADAGSTILVAPVDVVLEDHPRGCGEHGVPCCTFTCTLGSSPRMRGALGPGLRVPVPPGIIPADAGSTTPSGRLTGCSVDHPRGCGEHAMAGGSGLILLGSSPRMRGARSGYARRADARGIIPADAGSTVSSTTRWNARYQSSPRMRGAQSSQIGSCLCR